jgi:hypothetical protein
MESEYARELHEQLIALKNAHERAEPAGTAEMLKALRRWRAARMQATYADLYQSSRYRPAVDFLINDLFGTDKLGIRASQLQKAESAMVKVMPDTLLAMTVKAVHLTALTVELDVTLAEQLKKQRPGTAELTGEVVAEALRLCGDLYRYRQQIALVESVGSEIDTAVHKPFVAMALRMCRKPAHLMGLSDLQDFLERGFAAFKNMRGAGEFLSTFKARETAILDNVFSGRENPFELER